MDSLNEEKDVTVKIYLASGVRARFKAKCALQERSMNEVLLGFIQDFLDESPSNGKEITPSLVTGKGVKNGLPVKPNLDA